MNVGSRILSTALTILLALAVAFFALWAALSVRKWTGHQEPQPIPQAAMTDAQHRSLTESTSANGTSTVNEKEAQALRDAVSAKVPNNPLSDEDRQRLLRTLSAPQ